MALSHRGARVSGRVQTEAGRAGAPGLGELSVELVSRSPLSFPRNPVAKVDGQGRFLLTGVLPGRYRFAIKSGIRGHGDHPRPARGRDADRTGQHRRRSKEPMVVRPRLEDCGPERARARQCRTRKRSRQSRRTCWLSCSNEMKRTAMPETDFGTPSWT